jgi:phosphate-selective porin OprO/OprP
VKFAHQFTGGTDDDQSHEFHTHSQTEASLSLIPQTRIWIGVFACFAALLLPLSGQVAPDPRETLEQRVARLERLVAELTQQLKAASGAPKTEIVPEVKAVMEAEITAEVTAGVKRETAEIIKQMPAVSADTSGFTIKSADENFSLRIGADLQVDNRTYLGAGSAAFTDTALLRRVRPTISGTVYKYVDFFFRPDFGQGTTVIFDAYTELRYFNWARLRVGKFRPPVGLERLQSDDDTSFVERGLPTLLVPSRDIGYQLAGDILKNRVYYALGVFNGVPDNGLTDSATSNHRDYAARLFFKPFATSDGRENLLSGLSFGAGVMGGNVDGEALPSYKTVGQNTFISFNSGVVEAGHRTRLAPSATYYAGPFGLLTEYYVTEDGLQKGNVRHDFAFRAWQVEASYILTGERKSYSSPTPRRPFDPHNGGWGAFELAARTGNFSADTGLYGYGFLDPTKSPRAAREWVGGGNWYLNRLVRISLDYGKTNFTGGATTTAGTNRPPEKVLLMRFQINFI